MLSKDDEALCFVLSPNNNNNNNNNNNTAFCVTKPAKFS